MEVMIQKSETLKEVLCPGNQDSMPPGTLHPVILREIEKRRIVNDDKDWKLVRYIHLNPLRTHLVSNLWELDRYPWCGHAVLMGRIKNDKQDRDHFL